MLPERQTRGFFTLQQECGLAEKQCMILCIFLVSIALIKLFERASLLVRLASFCGLM
jgi:hypothetical protein